jgi:hypothetical protein
MREHFKLGEPDCAVVVSEIKDKDAISGPSRTSSGRVDR